MPPRRSRKGAEADAPPLPLVETPLVPAIAAPPIPGPGTSPRRAIFIDVENTSSETELMRVLGELEIDRTVMPTEISAVGNWRVIGQQLGRTLASHGAHLVHSAPATRVRDWSDLWIAVSAGMWLGRASSGDSIDIISDDRAFDAVGDAAARLGIAYRRISCRGHATVVVSEPAAAAHAREETSRTGGRRRRRHRGGERRPAATVEPRPQPVAPKRHHEHEEEEPHGASQAQIRAIIARLTRDDPARGVSLDALTVALKSEGFQRPPGSPRLITRLRRLKDLEVLPNARVRLVGDAAAAAIAESDEAAAVKDDAAEQEPALEGDDAEVQADGPAAAEEPGARPRRRSRRRGGRRHTRQPRPHQSSGA